MMGWSGLRILSALLIIFVGITLFGCKSKSSSSTPLPAAPAAPGGPGTDSEEGQPTITEPPVNPDGPLPTVAEYEARYNPAMLGAQSTYQKIRRDEIYGELTPEDAARQRICAHCQSDCLMEKYRDPQPDDNAEECGNHASQLIEYDVSRFPDLIDFFEQTCADTSGTTQQLMKPQGGGTLKTAVINLRPPAQLFERFFGYTEITAKNGITFTVRADDKTDNECEYKQIDTQTRVFTPGGPIDVYYRSQDARAFNDVVSALSNPQFWTYCNEVFGQCETNAYYNHENPSVFLIGEIKEGWGGLMVSNPDKGRGYIIVDSGSPSSACQRRSSGQGGGGGRGGGSGGGMPGVDEEIHWFLRANHPFYSNTEWLQAATTHELFHFAEMSHFSSNRKFSHPFIEAFADWMAKLVYPQSEAKNRNYHKFIYYPHHSFDDHSVVDDKNYAASVFWSFVSCHAGRAGQPKTIPIKKYEACIDGLSSFGKGDYRKCAREGIEYGSKKVAEVSLNFGESVLMSSGAEGFIGMEQCDPRWQASYLPGSIQATPHTLVDAGRGGSNISVDQTAVPTLEFDLSTQDFSVTYYVWISSHGDTYNNFYEFNLGRCADPMVKCSLFGYVIDDNRADFDFERYRVPNDGKRRIKFKELDKEPDLWVLVVADGRTDQNMNSTQGAPAFIETKPLSGPADFSIARTDNSGDSNNYTHFSLTFDGTLDFPGEDFPTRRAPDMPIVGPDMVALYELAPESHTPSIDDFNLRSFVPLKSGQMQWNMEYKRTLGFITLNRSCPATFEYSVTYSSQGTRPISLDADDIAFWHISAKDDSGNDAAMMELEVQYHESSLDVEFTKTNETCSASATCCQRGLENENLEPTSISTTSARVEDSFDPNKFSQTLSETITPSFGGSPIQTMATLTYLERVEQPEFWDNGNDFADGQLYYQDRDDDLMWQLVPEIIDFPRAVVPSRQVRQSMQTQNPPDI